LFAPVAQAQVDTTPPVLADFSFSPDTIDVSDGPQTVTATIQFTDDLAGASFGFVSFRSPSSQLQLGSLPLVAGSALNGTLEGTVQFPRYGENGAWIVDNLCLSDAAGNTSCFDAPTLEGLGFPTDLNVFSAPTDVSALRLQVLRYLRRRWTFLQVRSQ
jgi:hypothetical protein